MISTTIKEYLLSKSHSHFSSTSFLKLFIIANGAMMKNREFKIKKRRNLSKRKAKRKKVKKNKSLVAAR